MAGGLGTRDNRMHGIRNNGIGGNSPYKIMSGREQKGIVP
jgi:hypothetical protein